jgi:formamidopyrimidine-DNA glycosylase
MPELPEVETIARELAPLVVGATISGVWTDWPRAIRYPEPGEFGRGIAGREILAVGRRAKWLVLSLTGEMVLAIQVKMTGQIFVLPAGTVHDRHVHVRFELSDGRWMLFRDVRKFGRVGLYRRDEAGAILGADDEGELFGKHGPEPLSDAFTLRAFRERLRRRKGRLKALLLDQGFSAGVGNIYADEALWHTRLHWARPTEELRRPEARAVITAASDVMRAALGEGGTSFDRLYVDVNGRSGWFDRSLHAYGQAGRPCARCGALIVREAFMNRSSFRCPRCQRTPRRPRW